MKNNILLAAAVLTVGCLAMVIFSRQAVDKTQKTLDQERYNRMITEEKLEKALMKIKSVETELTNAQNQAQGIQTVLEKERNVNINLRSELDKMTKLKEVLEEQLKAALVSPVVVPPAGQ